MVKVEPGSTYSPPPAAGLGGPKTQSLKVKQAADPGFGGPKVQSLEVKQGLCLAAFWGRRRNEATAGEAGLPPKEGW